VGEGETKGVTRCNVHDREEAGWGAQSGSQSFNNCETCVAERGTSRVTPQITSFSSGAIKVHPLYPSPLAVVKRLRVHSYLVSAESSFPSGAVHSSSPLPFTHHHSQLLNDCECIPGLYPLNPHSKVAPSTLFTHLQLLNDCECIP